MSWYIFQESYLLNMHKYLNGTIRPECHWVIDHGWYFLEE